MKLREKQSVQEWTWQGLILSYANLVISKNEAKSIPLPRS
jgi:hypothetical protein